ncbi:MAG: glycosyltransferase family 117 protein [Rubrobacteraceae bacterium]
MRDKDKTSFVSELPFAAGISLLVIALYAMTLAPTVLYYSPENFDSAHLQIVAYILGIPSYTGYPTYAMLTHLFTYLPVGDVAYRVNLASAVFGAMAVGVSFLVCRRLETNRLGAMVGALAFGVGVTIWSQAAIAEVYTPHILLMSLFLLVLLAWKSNRTDKYLLLAVFLGGLAMTNHLTSAFLLPSAVFFVFLVDRSKFLNPGLLVKSAGAFMLGLSPYLYLPLRASMDPPLVNAGSGGNPATVSGFLDLVSGGDFKGRMFVFGPAELPERFAIYAGHLAQNLNPALLALAAVGIFVLWRRDKASFALLGSVYLLNLVYALEYDIEDLEIYFVPTYFVLCLFLAVSASATVRHLEERSSRLATAASALVFAAVFATIPFSYASADRSDDFLGREILETVANETERNSTVLYHGRTLHYMQLVEGRREDITLEDPFYTADWTPRAEDALERGPVYVLYPGATNSRLYREAGYELRPVREGMLYEVAERRQ